MGIYFLLQITNGEELREVNALKVKDFILRILKIVGKKKKAGEENEEKKIY